MLDQARDGCGRRGGPEQVHPGPCGSRCAEELEFYSEEEEGPLTALSRIVTWSDDQF